MFMTLNSLSNHPIITIFLGVKGVGGFNLTNVCDRDISENVSRCGLHDNNRDLQQGRRAQKQTMTLPRKLIKSEH